MVCAVLACISLFVGLLALWAGNTVYDSETFADRSVSMLDEAEVRTELAARLTEQLARSGNQNAVNFRPAFQLAVEAAIDDEVEAMLEGSLVCHTFDVREASAWPEEDALPE